MSRTERIVRGLVWGIVALMGVVVIAASILFMIYARGMGNMWRI